MHSTNVYYVTTMNQTLGYGGGKKKNTEKQKNRHCPSPVGISKDYEIEKNSLEELNSTIHWLQDRPWAEGLTF